MVAAATIVTTFAATIAPLVTIAGRSGPSIVPMEVVATSVGAAAAGGAAELCATRLTT